MGHRLFFRKLSQNRYYIQTFCNNTRNAFHFACRQWYLYNNPQMILYFTYTFSNTNTVIIIRIPVQIILFLENITIEKHFSRAF